MLSVIVPFRNRSPITPACLQSILESFNDFCPAQDVEYIFVDDASDVGAELVPLLLDFRKGTSSNVRILRFTQRQHYTRACAYAFSLAQGDIFFLSHDMVLTRECVQAMARIGALDSAHGIVRATANYVDCFPEHTLVPQLPLRDTRDISIFSRYVAEYFGENFTIDRLLTGDIMLIKHELVGKIGVMDTRYYGYFGDIDFGLRAQRAGYKLVCAKGAWLFHEGAGFYKNESKGKQIDLRIIHTQRMETVNNAYKLFREKWNPSLPLNYSGVNTIDFVHLRDLPTLAFDLHQPPLAVDPQIGEFL